MEALDDLDGVRRGALLGSHLDELAVLALGGDEQRTLGGIVAAGLFDVDVLAGLQPVDGHGRVPVVGRGDGDGVDIFLVEDATEVFVCRGRAAHGLLRVGGEFREGVAVDVADVSDMRSILIGLERGEMRIGAAVQADNREVESVV